MHLAVEERKELAKLSLRLGSHEAELNRIDTALVAAAKAGTRLPSPPKIFGALAEASIACAEVIDAYEAKPIPASVQTGLMRLHCAITDLAASLKLYAALSVSKAKKLGIVGTLGSEGLFRTRQTRAPHMITRAELPDNNNIAATLTGLLSSEQNEGIWRDLVNALPAAIYITDPRGRIIFYNDAAVTLWGCRPQLGKSEFCGSWKLYCSDGSPLPHDECPMALALKQKRPIRGMEAIAERPDGTRIPFIPYPTPLIDAAGELIGGVNMLVDITDRKRAEEVQQRFAAIIESSDDAILSKNLDGIIASWNPGAERLFGYKPEEIIGKSVTLLIPAERHNEEPEIIGRIRRGEHIDHYETVRLRKDGSLIDISLSVSPIKDSQGNVIGASKIARDITERKQAQARQEILTRELHHRTKNIFAVVQAVVLRSFAGKHTVEDAKTTVVKRLQSLANTHALLIDKQWQGADIAEVVRTEMSPYTDRVSIDGPSVILTAQAAQNFALALHELATNAAKYGALSTQDGQVRISWSVSESDARGRFTFNWQEQGGPRVIPPTGKGFGRVVLEQVMAEFFDPPPQIEFSPTGVSYGLSGSLGAITPPASLH